jgi:hypothetical protein
MRSKHTIAPSALFMAATAAGTMAYAQSGGNRENDALADVAKTGVSITQAIALISSTGG